MSKLCSRSRLLDMIAKAKETATAQLFMDEYFTVIVAYSGDALLLLLQPHTGIVNFKSAWQSLIQAWPYQLTSKPYLTPPTPPSMCAKFEPPLIVKRRPGPPKTSELISVHLQITPEMLADLKRVASQDGTSTNEVIRDAISIWLRNEAVYGKA